MLRSILPVAALLLVACGAKSTDPASSGSTADAEGGITKETKVPDDKNSRDFADHLIRTPMRDFKPGDTGPVELVWKTLRFGPKNRFSASGVTTADGETFECEENGAWAMPDAADAADKATIDLTIDKSTCPGRPQTGQLRLRLDAHGTTYDVSMR